jgi:hypothetical protein
MGYIKPRFCLRLMDFDAVFEKAGFLRVYGTYGYNMVTP